MTQRYKESAWYLRIFLQYNNFYFLYILYFLYFVFFVYIRLDWDSRLAISFSRFIFRLYIHISSFMYITLYSSHILTHNLMPLHQKKWKKYEKERKKRGEYIKERKKRRERKKKKWLLYRREFCTIFFFEFPHIFYYIQSIPSRLHSTHSPCII